MSAPLNYTTKISVHKTVAEVQQLLAAHGAARVGIDYADSRPSGVSFSLVTPHGPRLFTLPVNVDAMHQLLIRRDKRGELRSGSKADRTSREQAERVAWRVIKDWLAAQLAIVETEMVQLDQVMLPYLHVNGDRTLYQSDREQELRAIEGGGR
jgi:hypothetical protein